MKLRLLWQRIPKRAWVLLALQCAGLALLLLSASTLFSLRTQESLRANATHQRLVIDAATGEVSGLAPLAKSDQPAEAFGVAPEEKQKEPPEEKKPDEKKTDEAAPAETTPEAKKTEDATSEKKPAPAKADAAEDAPAITTDITLVPPVEIAPIARSKASLVPAPAPEITQKTEKYTLPKRGAKGAMPATIYARGFTWDEDPAKQKPIIAFVVVGLA